MGEGDEQPLIDNNDRDKPRELDEEKPKEKSDPEPEEKSESSFASDSD